MLNNGVFGDTGGQMTGATVIGQRTKTSLEGRDPELHGYPVPVAELMAQLEGAAYVARGAVNNAGSIAQTKKYLRRAFETQQAGAGLGVRGDPQHVPHRVVHAHARGPHLPARHDRGDVPGAPAEGTIVPVVTDVAVGGTARRRAGHTHILGGR